MRRAAAAFLASDAGVLAAIAALKLGLHLATSSGYGIFRDELYYIACSEHLAFGYVDHPPLSIWLLKLQRAALGDSLLALRFLPAVAGAALVFLTGWLARALGGGRWAQVLAAVCAFAPPYYLTVGHFYSMNGFEVLLWVLLAGSFVRIAGGGSGREREWIVFGLLAGLTLANKYQGVVYLLGMAAGLLAGPGRRQLRSPWLWLGAALGLAVVLPNLGWLVRNDWPILEFTRNARAHKIHPVAVSEFLAGQLLLIHPLVIPVCAAGLVSLLVGARMRPYRPLGIAFVATAAIFLLQQAKIYYLAPAYPPLMAAGAAALEPVLGRRGMVTAVVLVSVTGALLVPMVVPVLPAETVVAITRAVGLEEPKTEQHESAELHQTFADMHGWSELVETAERVVQGLAPAERAEVMILASNYGEAGAVEFLGRGKGLPPVISGHNSYHLWGPDGYRGGPLVALGFSRDQLSAWFERVEPVDVVRCRYCMPYQKDAPVYLCRGLRLPVPEFWAAVKRYI